MPLPTIPLAPFFPKLYNPNVHCEYHKGVTSYATNNYVAMNSKIYHLIKHGWFKLKKLDQPLNVNTNNLPNHNSKRNRTTNMINV